MCINMYEPTTIMPTIFPSISKDIGAIWSKVLQSNLAKRNGLIRNKFVLRNHFLWPICHLIHKDKELLAFLIAKFDCTTNKLSPHGGPGGSYNQKNVSTLIMDGPIKNRTLNLFLIFLFVFILLRPFSFSHPFIKRSV